MDRWLIGLILAFCAVFVANGFLVYFATSTPLEIDQTYAESHR